MADNFQSKDVMRDPAGAPVKFRSTDASGIHAPHVRAWPRWKSLAVDLSTDAEQVVFAAPCLLGPIYVDAVMSAHACPVIDGATTKFSLAASLAAGTVINGLVGIEFNTDLRINSNDSATGTILVCYWPLA